MDGLNHFLTILNRDSSLFIRGLSFAAGLDETASFTKEKKEKTV